MNKSHPQIEILQYLDMLGKSSQQKVLTFIKTLVPKSKKVKSKHPILKYAGAFSKEDVKEMEKAIKENCENIDKNEW